tara:strand:+ start:886 stop:1317 length:432 start_codon:yes stop_codon:yes gene_type:complete
VSAMRTLLALLLLSLPLEAAKCKGEDPCRACKDCSKCEFCTSGRGSCGISRWQKPRKSEGSTTKNKPRQGKEARQKIAAKSPQKSTTPTPSTPPTTFESLSANSVCRCGKGQRRTGKDTAGQKNVAKTQQLLQFAAHENKSPT